MTTKPKTHVGIVLDRSGSMGHIKRQAIDHFNEQVELAQNNSAEQDITFTLVTFNENVFEHHVAEPVTQVAKADADSYQPNGGTALWDAVGYTIKKMQEATEGDKEASYLLIIISDGEENQSTHYTSAHVREMIDGCQATGRWTVSYVGCDEKYLYRIAQATNIPISNMGVWSNENAEVATKSLRRSTMRYDNYYQSRNAGEASTDMLMSDAIGACANFVDDSPSQTAPPTPVKAIKRQMSGATRSSDVTSRTFNVGTEVKWTS